ncbi:MAG: polysaccharide biosynthesis/export family protein [Alphaproteobacteria bacterium]|nr:polysaccharide biosynthesis/export family protein [Alphaproteobacteria bacterium]
MPNTLKYIILFLTFCLPAFSPLVSPALAADAPEAASPSSYIILPGDVLQITVWKEDGLDRETLVLPDGSITFPLIGTIQAQGKSLADLRALIKKKLAQLIPDASVTVAVKAALGHTVNVIGQVTKPGEFVMGQHMTVMQALSQAGGLTPYASESGIIILRRSPGQPETSIPFPYDDVADGDDLDKDITLEPGDVVVVPTASLL